MFRIFYIVFSSSLLLWPGSSFGQEFEALDKELVQSSILNKHYYGFNLYDLDSNRMVYGRNADRYFTPASNTKVFTLFTALKHIGDSIPGIEYVERGDSLIFWGTGDPTFLHPKLDNRRVYDFLKYSDKTLYYVPQDNVDGSYRNGWAIEDYKYDYQTDIVPFPIYGNLVYFRSDEGRIKAMPSYFEHALAMRKFSTRHFAIDRQIGSNVFELSNANIPKSYRTRKPFLWSDSLFVQLLSDTLGREVVLLPSYLRPDDVKTLYSVPKNRVLREMMLPSDNFLAEHLTMVAAHQRFHAFLTDSLRYEMNEQYYAQFNDSIRLFDGSGLSTYNKVTPNSMISLLLTLEKEIGDEYLLRMFFPAGGVDGTLKRTYTVDKSGPYVWAKTGTLSSVYCQSGYLLTKSGRRFAFSFLNNNFVLPASVVRRELARIVTYIHQNY
ncbi:peptidase S13 [Parapedobacter sp. SGR-10]|uniref:D-alanyl-D-alanine carboxypeptidase n=1 Tax=Parapedobacter sp. SGR-10 TaxID=2710879 RepID=UPI0013D1E929|nr:D-alanyl-D-alanine carboxypeptidase [Parapedobacter sp. SGR-10]NGF57757.1 peptidase S13 [Parapedobacter sp. SGR-10]